jgi:hypothetical protein
VRVRDGLPVEKDGRWVQLFSALFLELLSVDTFATDFLSFLFE